MTARDDRAVAITPTAAALVAAVTDADADLVEALLTQPGLDWMALCVVLASYARIEHMPNHVPPLFTDEERRAHHAAFARGDTSALVRLGEREYQREAKRRQERRREAESSPAVLLAGVDGRWVQRPGGVRVWVNYNERDAG